MQKHVNLVDLVKSFPTNIYLQNLASIQKRTSPIKFAHLVEKSGNGSISNLSTKVTTTHMGLGTYSSKPMKNLTDEELIGFLKKSGVEEEDDSRLDAILPPFRADCELYEEYARPSALPVLPSKICVMRGKGDEVVTMSEISGWADEFDCDELSILRVPDATHHVHEEQPAVVADHVILL